MAFPGRVRNEPTLYNLELNKMMFILSKKATKMEKNLHSLFDTYYIMSNQQGRFHQFLWPSQKKL